MKRKFFLSVLFFLPVLVLYFSLSGPAQAKIKGKAAIFPFADHSFRSIASAEMINKPVDLAKALEKIFKNKGVDIIQKSFIERLLFAENIIRPFKFKRNPASYEWNMINSAFSSVASDTIIEYILKRYKPTAPLSRAKIISLSKDLGADFLVRGVILDKTPISFMQKDDILDLPEGGISRRIIPFFLRENFYYALTPSYENGLPAVNLKKPVSYFPFFKANQTVIQVIIFIQDGKTGNIIWSNSCKIKYPSKDYYYSSGFSSKAEEAMNSAMQSFFSLKEN